MRRGAGGGAPKCAVVVAARALAYFAESKVDCCALI